MNVAFLLQGSPSEDHSRRRQELRERERQRERESEREQDRSRDSDRERDREKEWERGRELDREQHPVHPPRPLHHPSPHPQYPPDAPKGHIPGAGHLMTHELLYDSDHHRGREPPQHPSYNANSVPPYGPGRHPAGPHPPPHQPPSLFLSSLATSPPGHQQPDYGADLPGPRDVLNRPHKDGSSLGKPSHLLAPYAHPNGTASEPNRSLPLSRPRSPSFGDYSGRTTPSMSSQAPGHGKGLPHREIHIQHGAPHLPSPLPQLSPLSRPHQAQQQSLQAHTISRRGPSGHGHDARSPAMGSLRPFEEAQFSSQSRGGLGSASTFIHDHGAAMDKMREKERMREREFEREIYEREREKTGFEGEKERRKNRALPPPSPNASTSAQSVTRLSIDTRPILAPGGGGVLSVRRNASETEHDVKRDKDSDVRPPTRLPQGPATAPPHHHHVIHSHHVHPHPHPHTRSIPHIHPHVHQLTHPHTHTHQHGHDHTHRHPHASSHAQSGHASRTNSSTSVLTLAPPGVSIPGPHTGPGLGGAKPELMLAPPPRAPSPTLSLSLAPGLQLHSRPPSQHSAPLPPPKQLLSQSHPSMFPGGPREQHPQNYSNLPLPLPRHPSQIQPPHQYLRPHRSTGSPPPLTLLHLQQQQAHHQYHTSLAPSPLPQKPTQPALHLGTFVYPHTPFPYFFPSSSSLPSSEDRETRVRILIPHSFLPLAPPRPDRVRIWGGGLGVGMGPNAAYQFRTPEAWKHIQEIESERLCARRVYTDDSDIMSCAIHAGKITWSGVRRARAAGRDLAVELAVRRELRYLGGPGVDATGRMQRGMIGDGDSRDVDFGLDNVDARAGIAKDGDVDAVVETEAVVMHSASWGNGHDGSGIEVLNAQWIPRGTVHSLGLKNRKQRMHEYAVRRRTIMGTASSNTGSVAGLRNERRPVLMGLSRSSLFDLPSAEVMSEKEIPEQKLWLDTTFVLGNGIHSGLCNAGFKYVSSVVHDLLFAPRDPHHKHARPSTTEEESSQKKKRRKLNNASIQDINTIQMFEMDADEAEGFLLKSTGLQDVILENAKEQFLVSAVNPSIPGSGDHDKENRDRAIEETRGSARRYNVYLVNRPLMDQSGSTGPSSHSEFATTSHLVNGHATEKVGDDTDTTKVKIGMVHDLLVPSDSEKAASGTIQPPESSMSITPTLPIAKKQDYSGRLRLLHRDLGADDIQFRDDGLAILNGRMDTEEIGWFIRVARWHWVR